MTAEIRQAHVIVTGTPGTVASAGTAERLMAVGSDGERTMAVSLLIYAEASNTGNLYVGDDSVDATNGIPIAPGYLREITSPDGGLIDLTRRWLDVDDDGDGYRFEYMF